MDTIQILVVEDNVDDARMTLRALGKLDPPVSLKLACDGVEALALLIGSEHPKPQMIFLDLKMPKLHGFDVLRSLRSDPGCRMIPVVILTSSNDPHDHDEAQRLGANGYICKPMDYDEYARLVCEAAAKYLLSTACNS
jgi:two-component system response regulator